MSSFCQILTPLRTIRGSSAEGKSVCPAKTSILACFEQRFGPYNWSTAVQKISSLLDPLIPAILKNKSQCNYLFFFVDQLLNKQTNIAPLWQTSGATWLVFVPTISTTTNHLPQCSFVIFRLFRSEEGWWFASAGQTLGPASMTSASEPDFTSDDLNTGFPGRLSCSWHVCIDVVACDKDVGKFGYLPLEKKLYT